MESRNWAPSRWSENGTRQRVRRVYKHALKDMELLIGPYEAALVFCEVRALLDTEQSRVELQRRGVQLIGHSA